MTQQEAAAVKKAADDLEARTDNGTLTAIAAREIVKALREALES